MTKKLFFTLIMFSDIAFVTSLFMKQPMLIKQEIRFQKSDGTIKKIEYRKPFPSPNPTSVPLAQCYQHAAYIRPKKKVFLFPVTLP